jgi:hypothetical protein
MYYLLYTLQGYKQNIFVTVGRHMTKADLGIIKKTLEGGEDLEVM